MVECKSDDLVKSQNPMAK